MRRIAVLAVLAAAALVAPSLSGADPAPVNLARNAVATATSLESSAYPASNAIDGDITTRWSSAFADPQTLTLDLGARSSISEIKLTWEPAFATAYTLDVSDNGTDWTTVETDHQRRRRHRRLHGADRDRPLRAHARHGPGHAVRLLDLRVRGRRAVPGDGRVRWPPTATRCPRRTAPSTCRCGSTRPPPTRSRSTTPPSDGTATAGKDYTAASGTLTFAPGRDAEDDPPDVARRRRGRAERDVRPVAVRAAASGSGRAPTTTITVQDDDETPFSGATKTIFDFEGDLNVLPAPINNAGPVHVLRQRGLDADADAVGRRAAGQRGHAVDAPAGHRDHRSYGGFSDDLADAQDWTPYDGFSFWVKGTNTGKSIEYEIKDGGADAEHSELWNAALHGRLHAVEARAAAVLAVRAPDGLPAGRRADRRQARPQQDVGLRHQPAGQRHVVVLDRRRAGLPAGRDGRGLRGREDRRAARHQRVQRQQRAAHAGDRVPAPRRASRTTTR